MSKLTYSDCHNANYLANWSDVAKFRKPIIAAVNGYAVKLNPRLDTFIFYSLEADSSWR